MRTSEYMFAITLCAAAPLALAQNHDPQGSVQVAAAGASDTLREDATDDHAPTSSGKQRSAFGQAIDDLAHALREEKARKARAAQVQGQPPQAQTMAPRDPTDAPSGDDAGTKVPQVAVQSGREF